jgi:peptidoglycan/xylan/chitin deacetylase (PgdA/CDA1 family)
VPDVWRPQARYAVETLALRWGIPLRFTTEPGAAHLAYTTDPSGWPAETCAIRFDPAMYAPETVCRGVPDTAGRCTWQRMDLPHRAPPDLVGGAFRLLTFLDETQVAEEQRDRRGIFRTAALPPERLRTADRPLVEDHAAAVLDDLLRCHPGVARARLPRWPQGRRLALAPSHDVDAVDLGAPLELATNVAKAVVRRSYTHLELVRYGLAGLGRTGPGPYRAFSRWREWERERGLRSTFYVFVLPRGVRRDLNDCKSRLHERAADWTTLRAMATEGWEIGLHPAIHTDAAPGAFEAGKAWLEARLGGPVRGLRHHYWALDWRDPVATHRRHQRAGFRYDSSIAWRDRAGFRAGTALPYHPFDPDAGRALQLIELPCTLMDGHILEGAGPTAADPDAASRAGRAIVERVHGSGGVLVTDWHQEAAFGRVHLRGYVETLDRVLAPLYSSSDVWLATPEKVCSHWQARTRRLLPDPTSGAPRA